MNAQQLANDLKATVGHPTRGKVVSIHLFGILRADELRKAGVDEVVRLAGIERTYGTEIRKGMALSDWVEIRKGL